MSKNFKDIALKALAQVALVFAGIQLSPIIAPASTNPLLAFLIPLGALIVAVILLSLRD